MKVKRFVAYAAEHDEGPYDVILATAADRLEAAISRKDEALRRCVETYDKSLDIYDVDLSLAIYAARAALEET